MCLYMWYIIISIYDRVFMLEYFDLTWKTARTSKGARSPANWNKWRCVHASPVCPLRRISLFTLIFSPICGVLPGSACITCGESWTATRVLTIVCFDLPTPILRSTTHYRPLWEPAWVFVPGTPTPSPVLRTSDCQTLPSCSWWRWRWSNCCEHNQKSLNSARTQASPCQNAKVLTRLEPTFGCSMANEATVPLAWMHSSYPTSLDESTKWLKIFKWLKGKFVEAGKWSVSKTMLMSLMSQKMLMSSHGMIKMFKIFKPRWPSQPPVTESS